MKKVSVYEQARRNLNAKAIKNGWSWDSPERKALFREEYWNECRRLEKNQVKESHDLHRI